MGIKIIDFIYISKKIYNFLEKEKINNFYYLDAKIELLRQYYMVTNVFLLSPDKKIEKTFDRIAKLEKYILIPYISKLGFWDLRKNVLNNITDNSKIIYEIKKTIKDFIKTNNYFCSVGINTYNKIFKNYDSSMSLSNNEKTKTKLFQEYVIHDEIFYKETTKILKLLKKINDNIEIIDHDAFIGVIGPLYNGWIDIVYENKLLYSFYSLATPIHIYKNKITSYFFNMSHCMWRELYFKFTKNNEMEELYIKLISKFLKQSEKNINHDFFNYTINAENFCGHYPFRNYYQVSNKLRMKNQYYFKYNIPEQKGKTNKEITDYFYRDFEGKKLLHIKISNLKNFFRLNYLYRRSENFDDKK